MAKSKAEQYLGDIFLQNGTPKPNHASRLSREWGKVNEILALFLKAPLSCWIIKSGPILRKSMLINTLLSNSEAWHGITEAQVGAFGKNQRGPN